MLLELISAAAGIGYLPGRFGFGLTSCDQELVSRQAGRASSLINRPRSIKLTSTGSIEVQAHETN